MRSVSGWSSPSTRRRRVRVSFWSWRACWCSPRRSQGEAEEAGRAQRFGVVLAEDSAAAGEGVVLELPGLLILAQRPQDQAEEAGCSQCDDVVLAQDSAAAGQGVGLELPGLLIVT